MLAGVAVCHPLEKSFSFPEATHVAGQVQQHVRDLASTDIAGKKGEYGSNGLLNFKDEVGSHFGPYTNEEVIAAALPHG